VVIASSQRRGDWSVRFGRAAVYPTRTLHTCRMVVLDHCRWLPCDAHGVARRAKSLEFRAPPCDPPGRPRRAIATPRRARATPPPRWQVAGCQSRRLGSDHGAPRTALAPPIARTAGDNLVTRHRPGVVTAAPNCVHQASCHQHAARVPSLVHRRTGHSAAERPSGAMRVAARSTDCVRGSPDFTALRDLPWRSKHEATTTGVEQLLCPLYVAPQQRLVV
jgi:hypothetical protein